MLSKLHSWTSLQLLLGLIMGMIFGFLLQKGQVTKYDVIVGQLLLQDFTVVKVMLTAIIVGMIGIHVMRSRGWAELHPKPGSVGATVLGGLLFGAGMAILGYCPGTTLGAIGQGSLDALLGGLPGMLLGGILYAAAYPVLSTRIIQLGDFGVKTIPPLFRMNQATTIVLCWALALALFVVLELAGL
ncbi:MAG: YeeE/YedE thiosulfate transporter family protein [Desulfovermiculus sp.]